MLPVLSLVTDLACAGIDARTCKYSDGIVVCVQSQGGPIGFRCTDGISEQISIPWNKEVECSALDLAPEAASLLVGFIDGTLVKIDLSEPGTASSIELPASLSNIPIQTIVHDGIDAYAIAAGSHAFVLNASDKVVHSLGPLPGEILDLQWARRYMESQPCLVALTAGSCHVWPDRGAGEQIVLPSEDSKLTQLAVASHSQFIIVATESAEVKCWSLNSILASPSSTFSLKPITLACYDAPVSCMAWDRDSKYLATSDGSDCTVWDLSGTGALNDTESIMCCGHDPCTHILCLSFQPDGPFLATVSNVGKLAIFDSRGFRKGGVAGPYATGHIEDPSTAIDQCNLTWLPDGRLLVASQGKGLHCYTVSAVEGEEWEGSGTSMASPMVSSLAAVNTPVDQACVEYISSPLTPPNRGRDESLELSQEGSIGLEQDRAAAAAAAATAAAAAALAPPLALPKVNSTSATIRPAPIRTSSKNLSSSSLKQLEKAPSTSQQVANQSTKPPPPRDAPPPPSSYEPGTSPSSRAYIGRGRTTRRSDTGAGGAPPSPIQKQQRQLSGGSSSGGGMSPSLLEHIQHIRDAPPSERPDQHEELTGWGYGMSGSATIPPWMGGVAAVPTAASPVSGTVGMSGAAMYQGYAPAMQAMPGMQFATPAAAAASRGYVMAPSPHPGAPVAAGGVMMPPGAQAMQAMGWAAVPGGQGGYVMVPVPQQAQQWAGIAPGYMAYQHGAAFGMPAAAAGAHPGGASGGSSSSAYMPRSPVSNRFPSTSSGSSSFHNPSSTAHHRNNVEAAGGGSSRSHKGMTETEATEVNNGSHKSEHRKKSKGSRKGSGSSSGMSAAAEAAVAAVDATAAAKSATTGSGEISQRSSGEAPSLPEKGDKIPSAPADAAGKAVAAAKAAAAAATASPRSRTAYNRSISGTSASAAVASGPTMPATPPSLSTSTAAPSPTVDSSCTIYLGNLPSSADEHALYWSCASFGPVSHVQIIREKATNMSRGYGFVTFTHPSCATIAMHQLNGQMMYGPFGGQRIKAGPTNKATGSGSFGRGGSSDH